ncbi:MAG: TIGR03790 family protein, partial [Verrucomicrobiae bacterium]|nr:TIGR03790 family protein [Verrucomicrobiae bacterium]NNJ86122.1 TIGR03790 family protein [Akkermansiaceae bacterium]
TAGDQWLESIAKLNNTTGIPTVIDRNKQTFTTNYPMNDAALYYGWYTTHKNGPLLNKDFKFRPGAVAIHLHSYSASHLRDPNKNWTGPLLAKGAAATVGNVYEPYLQLTHHFDILHDRLIKGYSLIEAAYMSTPALSWQNIVLGDPLYRPFVHLDGTGTKDADDRDYRAIRIANERWGKEPETMVKKLRTAAAAKANGRFYEYLGLWHRQHKQPQIAMAFFQTASKKHIKESDRLRQWLYTADMHRQAGNKALAIATLREAKEAIDDIPEAKTTVALLNILDPPPPPPAKKPAAKPTTATKPTR